MFFALFTNKFFRYFFTIFEFFIMSNHYFGKYI